MHRALMDGYAYPTQGRPDETDKGLSLQCLSTPAMIASASLYSVRDAIIAGVHTLWIIDMLKLCVVSGRQGRGGPIPLTHYFSSAHCYLSAQGGTEFNYAFTYKAGGPGG